MFGQACLGFWLVHQRTLPSSPTARDSSAVVASSGRNPPKICTTRTLQSLFATLSHCKFCHARLLWQILGFSRSLSIQTPRVATGHAQNPASHFPPQRGTSVAKGFDAYFQRLSFVSVEDWKHRAFFQPVAHQPQEVACSQQSPRLPNSPGAAAPLPWSLLFLLCPES